MGLLGNPGNGVVHRGQGPTGKVPRQFNPKGSVMGRILRQRAKGVYGNVHSNEVPGLSEGGTLCVLKAKANSAKIGVKSLSAQARTRV